MKKVKYYKIRLDNNDIDDFLFICNNLDFIIVSVLCSKNNYTAIYKGRYEITNLGELCEMILEGK